MFPAHLFMIQIIWRKNNALLSTFKFRHGNSFYNKVFLVFSIFHCAFYVANQRFLFKKTQNSDNASNNHEQAVRKISGNFKYMI